MLGRCDKQYTKTEWETVDVMREETLKKRIVWYMVRT